jgi:hypothetical protein
MLKWQEITLNIKTINNSLGTCIQESDQRRFPLNRGKQK